VCKIACSWSNSFCRRPHRNIINICQLAPQWSSSMDDRAMCEKCRKLDEKIAHYREVATWVMDERTLEGIEMLIRNLEAEKAALHR